MEIAADAIRTAAVELLQAGRVHPDDLVLGDLAEVVRDAGQDHAEALRAVELPVAAAPDGWDSPRLSARPSGYTRGAAPASYRGGHRSCAMI
jgi:hypothetical protein